MMNKKSQTNPPSGKLNKAYHYTSLPNWEKMKKEGLKLGIVGAPEVKDHFEEQTLLGSWGWKRPQEGDQLLGIVVYQKTKTLSDEIVAIEVSYYKEEVLITDEKEEVKILNIALGFCLGILMGR